MTAIKDIKAIIKRAAPVMPVLVVNRVEDAVPLARALVDGGVLVLEVTLRTPASLEVIRAMKTVEGVLVGAGTVINSSQFESLLQVEPDFLVSPGFSAELVNEAKVQQIPILPGVSTASEIMAGLEAGLDCFKFFPAEAAGGLSMLRAFSGPFPQVTFCPTGGISYQNYKTYLALPNVGCVGGSWIASAEGVAKQDWASIQRQARSCRE